MRYAPSEAELACMEAMDSADRLHYFISRSMECEEVWSLRNAEGWVSREHAGRAVIPVWPYRMLAENVAGEGEAADAVSLEHFVYHELNDLHMEAIGVEIIPGRESGLMLSASELFQIFDRKMDEEQYFIEG